MNKLITIIISIAMGAFAIFGLGLSVAALMEATSPSDAGVVVLIMIAVLINGFIAFQLIPMDSLKARSSFRGVDYATMNPKGMKRTKSLIDHKEFETIYTQLLDRYQVILNRIRRPIAIKRTIQILAAILTVLGFIFFTYTYDMKYAVVLLFGAVLFCISIAIHTNGDTIEGYKKTYLETVFTGMIEKLDDTELNEVGINEAYSIAYTSKEMGLKTINYMKNPPTYETFGGKTININIHEGIRAELDADKGIGAQISVVSNVDEAHYICGESLKKIEMDSPEFESMYNLYSDNPVIAMRLITSDILELLSKAKMFLGLDIRIRTTNRKIILEIPMYDVIGVGVLNSDLNKDLLMEYFEIIKIIRKIMLGLYKEIEHLEV